MIIPRLESSISIGGARRALARIFAAAGLDTPALDARVLIGHALGLDHTALVAAAERALDAAERERIAEIASRRLAREPVSRIVGVKEFWGLSLRVNPAVLVPRPETETVVTTALAALDHNGGRARPLRIADLGTGSGALLLALLSELSGAIAIGTDLSVAALALARENARQLDLATRAVFVACDFAAALAGPFDLVVANPPYVSSTELAQLAPEVRDHDPLLALDGGPDGLRAYRALAADASRLIGAGGHMVIEVGAGQGDAVASLFTHTQLLDVTSFPDLTGRSRALHIRSALDA
ncbi:MAG: peptide chain release factor N(5)-glutamine methyltransferase [Hyphomicrobiales bacterium]|nr:peptide chain release factor N(5)-glutamine methyltransferase [Hyphomicrobiales bacterium]MBV8827236.1 peptide chain release factor N(5)-glutamine methyltransferase [Hyphomicrobiales bacterium]MBV9427701.1 peptide chain release factor N(5)-glutamine methyltransferase [Bradyrhizobiaceae bacterium]